MIKKLLTLLALSFCLTGKGQTYVAIPDSGFVHYLKTIVPTAFKGDSLNTSSTFVTTTTHSITIPTSSIIVQSLSGIQYFTSLKYLNCSSVGGGLSVPAILPNSLETLLCDWTGWSNLPSLPNTLVYISSVGNFLTTLPTLPTSLKYLNVSNNLSVSSLPALPTSLSYLDCGANQLSSLPALPTSLKYLYCDTNGLSSLPTLPDSLIALSCGNNLIRCFPTLPSSLSYVNLNNTLTQYGDTNSYNCLPNYVLPAMNSYTTTPLCTTGNTHGCPVAVAGISQISGLNTQISIYPNPNNGSFIIEPSSATKQTMQVYDVNGKMVLRQSLTPALSKGEGVSIDASSLNEGVYNISIISNDGVVNKRIVIVK